MTLEKHKVTLILNRIESSTYLLTNNPTPTATPMVTIAIKPTTAIALDLEVAGWATSFLSATAQENNQSFLEKST